MQIEEYCIDSTWKHTGLTSSTRSWNFILNAIDERRGTIRLIPDIFQQCHNTPQIHTYRTSDSSEWEMVKFTNITSLQCCNSQQYIYIHIQRVEFSKCRLTCITDDTTCIITALHPLCISAASHKQPSFKSPILWVHSKPPQSARIYLSKVCNTYVCFSVSSSHPTTDKTASVNTHTTTRLINISNSSAAITITITDNR